MAGASRSSAYRRGTRAQAVSLPLATVPSLTQRACPASPRLRRCRSTEAGPASRGRQRERNSNSHDCSEGRTTLETARHPAAKHVSANTTLRVQPPCVTRRDKRNMKHDKHSGCKTHSPSGPCVPGGQVIVLPSAHPCLRHAMPRMRRASPLVGDVSDGVEGRLRCGMLAARVIPLACPWQ